MQTEFDIVIVGSGINSLVCAALVAKQGLKVCVLERNRVFGGCIRSDELTLPGFLHDTLSGFHPLFTTSPAYATLHSELRNEGLQYCNTDKPTGAVLPDGSHAILTTSRTTNERAFDALCPGDGATFAAQMREVEKFSQLTFGLLGGELWSASTFRLLASQMFRHTPRGLLQFFGESMQSSRHWLDANFSGSAIKALLAPWVLHTGLGPDGIMAGFMNRLIAYTLEAAGMPIVAGGSAKLVAAFRQLIERYGGTLVADAEVVHILVKRGRADGVRMRGGQEILARKAVVCSVTPTQLYLQLLPPDLVPLTLQQSARAYRYGRADMQIHLALSEPPRWAERALSNVAMVHVTGGVDAIATAVNEAERGLLPARPTIVVGQPTAIDPTRAPPGAAILWLQMQELPSLVKGDAAGLIHTPDDGPWSTNLKELYAQRVLATLRPHIENLDSAVIGRCVLSPADLEALNMNLVGGDPYAGACTFDQSLLWRPLPSTVRHETNIKALYHIGASTHPGPGLGGTSGYLVAKALAD